MDRREESEAGTRAFQPGNLRFERLKTVKSNPDMFIQLQAFVQFDLTSVRRSIEHTNAKTDHSASRAGVHCVGQSRTKVEHPAAFGGRSRPITIRLSHQATPACQQ